MSFFRPEATARLRRWAETAIYAAATVLAVWWLWPGGGALWRWALPVAALALGLWFCRAAAVAALAGGRKGAPGVVLVDERRITYLGPHDGGFASINELKDITIGHGQWVLTDEEGTLPIPIAAEGAGALPDAFAALPGFSPGRALQALAGDNPRPVTIWRRDEAPARLRLASGGASE